MTSKEWFAQAKFGMMIHWGLYSLLGGEWNDNRTSKLGEWIMYDQKIPVAEYEKLTAAFNPVYFDPEKWVQLAKEAGMQYIVITAKHHEGFALYHSANDKYNVVDATPYGKDIIAQLHQACKKHDMKLGLYYSQEVDWHEPDGGYFAHNSWDYPDRKVEEYQNCFEKKIKPQVKELVTMFDDLLLIWFDTPKCITPEQSDELYFLIKQYQPECLINSRIGNGRGDYRSTGDNRHPDETQDMLCESPCTMNDTWGFKYFDQNWKSVDRILEIKKHLNDRGINYLLNVGPDALGRIPVPSVEILRELAKRR